MDASHELGSSFLTASGHVSGASGCGVLSLPATGYKSTAGLPVFKKAVFSLLLAASFYPADEAFVKFAGVFHFDLMQFGRFTSTVSLM